MLPDRVAAAATIPAKTVATIKLNDPGKALSPTLDPILAAPVIDAQLYRKLMLLSLDYVLPGLDLLMTRIEDEMESNFCAFNNLRQNSHHQ